jgi:RHS repeat-associated protein
VTTYDYDNANRLTSISNQGVNGTIAGYNFVELDANGNRKRIAQTEPYAPANDSGTVTYTYNTQKNRLQSTSAQGSFGYDDEGQLQTGYSATYTFDYEHRLKTIGGTTQFYYDGSGNRLKATRSGVTTKYIYDAAGRLLAEADVNNNITRYYIYGNGLLATVTTTNQIYCYHFNGVGSTVAITDNTQAIVNQYSYDAFGNVANQLENTILQNQPFKYVGQYGVMTEPNGFYYMKARYYDPTIGRFISEDPTGFDGGDVNLMAYVGNNPVTGIDPWGLELRIYNRLITDGPLAGANHAFLYSTVTEQAWGTSGSSGSGAQVNETYTINNGTYSVVPNPNNISEVDVMNYMKDTRNSGLYFPFLNDCHTHVDTTLSNFGLENPGAPGGRLGTIPPPSNSTVTGTISIQSGGSGK